MITPYESTRWPFFFLSSFRNASGALLCCGLSKNVVQECRQDVDEEDAYDADVDVDEKDGEWWQQ